MRTTGLILAAGKSLRMAPFRKLELNLGNRSILERTLFSLMPFCERIIIVATPEGAQVFERLKAVGNLSFVLNPTQQSEMIDSLRLGLHEALGDQVLITPGDCPFAHAQAIQSLLTSTAEIAVLTYEGQAGHPVLLRPNAVKDLLEAQAVHSLRDFLVMRPVERIEVEESGILRDIDTPADYAEACALYQESVEGL